MTKKLPPANNDKIKLKTERSFYSTKKKITSKKEGLRKPSSQEKETIRKEILNLDYNDEDNSDMYDHTYCLKQTDIYDKEFQILTTHQQKLLKKHVN